MYEYQVNMLATKLLEYEHDHLKAVEPEINLNAFLIVKNHVLNTLGFMQINKNKNEPLNRSVSV